MFDRVGWFGSCVLRRFMDLRYEPAALAAGVILLLCTQAGFWIDAQNNWGFDPMNLGGALLLSVGTALFWVPVVFILLVAGTQREGWLRTGIAVALSSRLTAAALMFLAMTGAAAVLLVPAVLTGLLTLDWNETVVLRWSTLGYVLEHLSRALWVGSAYGALCAFLTVLFRSRGVGASVAVALAFVERLAADAVARPFTSLSWVDGFSLGAMYQHWLGDQTLVLGSMTNVLGLEDGLQGFLVIGFYLVVFCLLTLATARLRGRRDSGADRPSLKEIRRERRFRTVGLVVACGCAALAVSLGLLLAALGPPSPKWTASHYLYSHMGEMADVATGSVSGDSGGRSRLSRDLEASWGSVIFPLTCDELEETELASEPVLVTCRVMSLDYGVGHSRVRIPIEVEVHGETRLGFPVHRVGGLRLMMEEG